MKTMTMKRRVLYTAAALAAGWMCAAAAPVATESYQIVKRVDHDGSATFEMVSQARSRELVAQNALENQMFQQALAQAKQAWMQDPTRARTPFPTVRLEPRKVAAAGGPLPSMEKATAQKAKLDETERTRWFNLTQKRALPTEAQQAAIDLFEDAIRDLREQARVAALAKGAPASATGGDWVQAMRELNARFDGTKNYVAQFGDSITYSMAFWKFISWTNPDEYLPDDGLPRNPGKRWRDTILGAGNEGKGEAEGNYSKWTSADLLKAVPGVLANRKPEVAIIMIGSNDSAADQLAADYATNLQQIVRLCLDAECIPILSTIPPRRGCPQSVSQANAIIEAAAARYQVPLVDFHGAIMQYAPAGEWDRTLISEDGVHPSGGDGHVFTPENLAKCGFAVRNYVTFLKYREVYFKVLHPQPTEAP